MRNKFVDFPAPTEHMSSHRQLPPLGDRDEASKEVRFLAAWFEQQPDAKERFQWALRDSLDELMDGQRTGRWCYQQLTKTEKTHLGTVVEVNLTKEFELADGADLDWNISGIDLDCKFSKSLGGWEIPMEMYLCPDHEERSGKADHPALLVWLCDDHNLWGAGIIQVTDSRLGWTKDKNTGLLRRRYNRDNKRTLSVEARDEICWLWGRPDHALPTNTLRHLDDGVRARIFADKRSGQKRTNELFSQVRNVIIRRATVLTVAKQDDAPKRARDARIQLRSQGIAVLGHQGVHPKVAALLGLDVPTKGEWISVRLAPVEVGDSRSKFWHSGRWWAKADSAEPETPAPDIADIARPGRHFEVPLGPDELAEP
jgi:hypothetical protein